MAKKKNSTNVRPWRKVPDKWTDTMFRDTLLKNPSLMTNQELAKAIIEYQLWRSGKDKYAWSVDPEIEGKEDQAPFSMRILSHLLIEVATRMELIGDLVMGRKKTEGMDINV